MARSTLGIEPHRGRRADAAQGLRGRRVREGTSRRPPARRSARCITTSAAARYRSAREALINAGARLWPATSRSLVDEYTDLGEADRGRLRPGR